MSHIFQEIRMHLPVLRRYARAMSGSPDRGDRFTELALKSILYGSAELDDGPSLKVALFQALQDAGGGSEYQLETDADQSLTRANRNLAELTPKCRDAFLLNAFEDFSHREIATIMRCSEHAIEGLIAVAREELDQLLFKRILVIEDELSIAHEISEIVSDMGHTVIGTASSGEDALELAEREEPDLILSDIKLANGGSGIKAVGRILKCCPFTPVVYFTGFPERLLTGTWPKPAFLVTKPFKPDQVRSAISQAMLLA